MCIRDSKPAEVLQLLQKIELSGRRETAHRLREVIGGVFRLAIQTLRAETDPTAPLKGALLKPKVTHRPAITDEEELGALWANLADYDGWPTLNSAQLIHNRGKHARSPTARRRGGRRAGGHNIRHFGV